MRHNERGFTSTWLLVLSMLILAFGAVAFDVWQVFIEQRRLAARADAAAAAAAQAVNVSAFTDSGGEKLVLDPEAAEALALARLEKDLATRAGGSCGETLSDKPCWEITVTNPGDPGVPPGAAPSVTVTLRQRVDLAAFLGSQDIAATSTASPQVA